jgi:hypothetical protein
MLQTNYDTLLFQTGLLHFGIVSHHLLQISLETSQHNGTPIDLLSLVCQIKNDGNMVAEIC